MDSRAKCQLAEMIGEAIDEHGLEPRTKPYVWMASLLGPVFERHVPMNSRTYGGGQSGAGVFVLLLPVLLLVFILAGPVEWWRTRRAKLHNEKMNGLLQSVRAGAAGSPGGAYRHAPRARANADAVDWLGALRTAERLLAVDFRIESRARPSLVGTALIALASERKTLTWFNVHRSVPRKGFTDGHAVRSMLEGTLARPIDQVHWVWQTGDPYDLAERETRPW